jgi:acyl CoA:acetate/3-ketoacid CoA transferase alpha subunit
MKCGKCEVTCYCVHLQMMSNPEFVRQMLNPGTMRQMMQMQQMMGGMGAGGMGAGGFPGATADGCKVS